MKLLVNGKDIVSGKGLQQILRDNAPCDLRTMYRRRCRHFDNVEGGSHS